MAQFMKLTTTDRTGTGKGAARRARRDGLVPAVLYGHGTDPKHLLLPNLELAAILRANGTNAVIDLDIDGTSQLALTKQVDVHPVRNYIEHVDLLIVRRGEKVVVEVPILIEGESGPGTLLIQDASYIELEAEAMNIPENIVVSVEGLPAVTNINAGDLELPEGSTLISAEDTLVVSVNEAQQAAEPESEEGEEGAAETAAEEAAE
ncbi:50S ribosomal protein L25/general stress protein Ctc [Gordonia caeni]|uniref:Large ribosomal subunit protein bL25 n=1 Tax=Gordonia caeni TaxID=1007097 RepID=A0ABP7PQ51_9ACTN